MTGYRTLIEALWDALNRRDVEAAVALIHPEADWQDLMSGGRRQGRDAMRDYWNGVFRMIHPATSPLDYRQLPDGRVAARVLHSIHDTRGKLWSEEVVTHVFEIRDGLLSRMDVAAPD